jgi:ribosomal protein L7/L12
MLDKLGAEGKKSKAEKPNGKREKFVSLAENRTRTAIKAIRTIAKLGNRNAYDYTEADVKRIAGALTKEIDALKSRMLSTGGKDAVDFTL